MIGVALLLIIWSETGPANALQIVVGGILIGCIVLSCISPIPAGRGAKLSEPLPPAGLMILPFFLIIWTIIQFADVSAFGSNRLTLSQTGTLNALSSLIICVGIFGVGFFTVRAKGSLHVLRILGMAISATAIISFLLMMSTWGHDFVMEGHRLRGPLAAKNEFAALLSIGVLVNFTIVLMRGLGAKKNTNDQTNLLAWLRRHLIELASIAILLLVLSLTESRGATIALVCSLFVFIALDVFLKRRLSSASSKSILRPIQYLGIATLLAIVTTIGAFSKFIRVGLDDRGRFDIYQATLQAIQDNWIFGTGMGSFEDVIGRYQSVPGAVPAHAHNDYLETILTFGVPMALVALGIFVWLGVLNFKGLFQSNTQPMSLLGLAALTFLGTHSLMDHPAQSTAVLAVFFAIQGACLSQALRPPVQAKNSDHISKFR